MSQQTTTYYNSLGTRTKTRELMNSLATTTKSVMSVFHKTSGIK